MFIRDEISCQLWWSLFKCVPSPFPNPIFLLHFHINTNRHGRDRMVVVTQVSLWDFLNCCEIHSLYWRFLHYYLKKNENKNRLLRFFSCSLEMLTHHLLDNITMWWPCWKVNWVNTIFEGDHQRTFFLFKFCFVSSRSRWPKIFNLLILFHSIQWFWRSRCLKFSNLYWMKGKVIRHMFGRAITANDQLN